MRSPKIIIVFFLSVLFCFAAIAQPKITGYTLLNQSVSQYEKAEWEIRISAGYNNPYNQKDITLDMALISPSGKRVALPCYFESGDTVSSGWKARFTPQEAGKYSYTFRM